MSIGRVAILFLVFSFSLPVAALAGQWSIDAGVGAAFFRPTVYDGTWRQDGVQAPNFRLMDQAWTVGLDYRINPQWSVQGHRFDWGSSGVKSRFVSDSDYDPVNHRCLVTPCTGSYSRVLDRLWGYDLTGTRHFQLDSKLQPHLTAGVALAFHEVKWGDGNGFGPTRVNGAIPMLVVGGGVCYGVLCWDNRFYTGTLSMNGQCIGGGQYDCGYPIAKQVGTSMVMVKIPFWKE